MSRIIVACDSLKGCLNSADAGKAIGTGVKMALPDAECVCLSVADGGEGTATAVRACVPDAVTVRVPVHDPLLRQVEAEYLILPNGKALIESAQAIGLALVGPNERDVAAATSFGLGEIVMDALAKGCRDITLTLGGSATNDAATGMLTAMGFKFLDSEGRQLAGTGGNLGLIRSVDTSSVPSPVLELRMTAACDVEATFCGPDGAAATFARQKGADDALIRSLDEGMESLCRIILRHSGTDIRGMSGAGAAGGISGTLRALLNADTVCGADMVLDLIGFDSLLNGCALVITGEGRIDRQTAMGKLPARILRRAAAAGVPVIALAGRVERCAELDALGFLDIVGISDPSMPDSEAMRPLTATRNLTEAAFRAVSGLMRRHDTAGFLF